MRVPPFSTTSGGDVNISCEHVNIFNRSFQKESLYTVTFSDSKFKDFGDSATSEADVDTADGERDATDFLSSVFPFSLVHRLTLDPMHHRQHKSGYLQHRIYIDLTNVN